jgi:hypothetical protein
LGRTGALAGLTSPSPDDALSSGGEDVIKQRKTRHDFQDALTPYLLLVIAVLMGLLAVMLAARFL